MPLTEKYISKARAILEEIARNQGSPIFYSDLTARLGIATQAAGGVLIPVSSESYRLHQILLSAVVVSKSDGLPSKRFFDQAKELGAMGDSEIPQIFHRAALQRVYDSYRLTGSKKA
jgi:hypothetical protein